MKKIVLFLELLFFTLSILSCNDDIEETTPSQPDKYETQKWYEFIIRNETPHDVDIQSFDSQGYICESLFSVDSIVKWDWENRDNKPFPFKGGSSRANVRVIFDNAYFSYFGFPYEPNKYDIGNKMNYTKIGERQDTLVYLYTITEEDYLYALKYGGRN